MTYRVMDSSHFVACSKLTCWIQVTKLASDRENRISAKKSFSTERLLVLIRFSQSGANFGTWIQHATK
jgi:hypothetical protein